MKKIVSLTLFLALISALAGGSLAAVNSVTAPIIEENKIAVEKESLEQLYPGAEFKIVEFKDADPAIQNIFEVVGEGYVFKMNMMGYKGDITYLVGIDTAGTISGYKVLSQEETQGIGTKIMDQPFVDGLLGNSANAEFDAIGGATVSSTAVLDGIKIASEYFGANLGELGEPGEVVKNYGTVTNEVANADGSTAYTVEVAGFKGTNTVDLSVDAAGVITAFAVTTCNDSPKDDYVWGCEITTTSFTDKFIGQSVSEEFGVDVISGATVSSESAMNAVRAVAQARAAK